MVSLLMLRYQLHKLDMPSVFRVINTGFQILVGHILNFCVQQVDEVEIGSICHLSDDTL